MEKRLPPRRSSALKIHIRDLNQTPLQRYVEIQRERGKLVTFGKVDVDIEQLIERRFLCDRHRCVQWTPHEKKAQARPLIDNSCCSRYMVPVTGSDRHKLAEIMPRVRKRLDKGHPLNVDPAWPPYEIDREDYGMVMRDQPNGACQFALYEKGLTTCAIHKTCLEEGLDVWEYKPLGCSLWPLALVDYEADDGPRVETRYLLTIYSDATAGIFDEDEAEHSDEGSFACLVDKDDAYEPLYKSCEGILRYVLGAQFYSRLDRAAKKLLGARA
jgi:hypothetical protein